MNYNESHVSFLWHILIATKNLKNKIIFKETNRNLFAAVWLIEFADIGEIALSRIPDRECVHGTHLHKTGYNAEVGISEGGKVHSARLLLQSLQ